MSNERDTSVLEGTHTVEKIEAWLMELDMAGSCPSLERLQDLLSKAPVNIQQSWSNETIAMFVTMFFFGMYEGRCLHERILEPSPPIFDHLYDILRCENGDTDAS